MKKYAFAALAAFVLMIAGCSQPSPGGQLPPGGGSVDDPLSAVPCRELIEVPGGAYDQSDPYGRHFTHSISALRMGVYEVTYDLWYAVRVWAEQNGYGFFNQGMEGSTSAGTYPNYVNIGKAPTAGSREPATMISWRDAIVWCNAYSEMEGLDPCYSYSGLPLKTSAVNGGYCDQAVCDWAASGYRLPSEGEWQYAATYINGTNFTPCSWASGASDLFSNLEATGAVAWFVRNSGIESHDVGTKAPNSLGVYDMSGNLEEWIWDCEGGYPDHAVTDYRGAAYDAMNNNKIMRGGAYNTEETSLRLGERPYMRPDVRSPDKGFRVARGAV
jgi:formylglycine-generating enzyme